MSRFEIVGGHRPPLQWKPPYQGRHCVCVRFQPRSGTRT